MMNNKKELTVEELQIKLSDVAAQYRSSEEDSVLHHQVLNEYYTIFNTLVEWVKIRTFDLGYKFKYRHTTSIDISVFPPPGAKPKTTISLFIAKSDAGIW